LDARYAWARKISPVVMILFLAGLLSNVGLITDRSTYYEALVDFTVPFAVCLILFTVNLADLRRAGGPLLAAFAVACVGTVIGVLVAGLLLDPQLGEILGRQAWKLAGPFTGTYTGGSLNFFAMWEGLEIGNLSFYLFFCAVGAMINVKKAIVLSPILFIYVMVMIALHMVFVYGVGRLLRLDIRILTIASAAAKSGPPTVVALANVHGWRHLVLPGVAMGLLGYAVGNYLGFAAAYTMKALLGQ
jgi:uncharacterized membrane protein